MRLKLLNGRAYVTANATQGEVYIHLTAGELSPDEARALAIELNAAAHYAESGADD